MDLDVWDTVIRKLRSLRGDLPIIAVFLAGAGCLSVAIGQTAGWDLLNYHLYNAWALLHHRWWHDFFVADIQGFFDPLGELPYYFVSMVWLPDHPRWVAFLAGLPYGVLCYLGFWISRELIGGLTWLGALERYVAIAVATALASSSVFAWSQLGTTTGELPVSVLVMAGVAVLLRASRNTCNRPVGRRSALAIGLFLGAGAGLKLTAAVYAPAMGVVLLFSGPDFRHGVRAGIFYLLGWMLAFGVLYGFWGVLLYTATGNPFFPMFNNFFHSPFAASVTGRDLSLYPDGFVRWILLPFFWIFNHGRVSNGAVFHEPRLALFFVLLLVFGAVAIYRKSRRRQALGSRPLGRVILFCVLSYVAWIVVFALARYIVVIVMLGSIASVVMVLLVTRSVRSGYGKGVRVGFMLVAAGGVGYVSMPPHTKRVPYADRVYVSNTPKLEKNAMVILGSKPMGLPAVLIGMTNPSASFIGLSHCFIRGNQCDMQFFHYRLGKVMREAIEEHQGPIYIAYPSNNNPSMPQLARFGLTLSRKHCRVMRTNVTREISICRAEKVVGGMISNNVEHLYKLIIDTTVTSPSVHVSTQWLTNDCGEMTKSGQLQIRWSSEKAKLPMYIWIESTVGRRHLLAKSPRHSGKVTTGPWVNARQTFVISDAKGKELAEMAVNYGRCTY